MKKLLSLVMVIAVFCAAPALAADPIIGTWKLNVSKSKFGDAPLTAGPASTPKATVCTRWSRS